MRGTGHDLQRISAGLPLWSVPLPSPCSNDEYAARMRGLIGRAVAEGITHMAFGDLFLEDVRQYRVDMLKDTGLTPVFPLFGTEAQTPALAREMQRAGVEAILTCVDPKQLDPVFVGRAWDGALLGDLPAGVDPCGERGEFHTFCWAGPMFGRSIPVLVGERVDRDGFTFADLSPATGHARGPRDGRRGHRRRLRDA